MGKMIGKVRSRFGGGSSPRLIHLEEWPAETGKPVPEQLVEAVERARSTRVTD